jgi:glycosyltransferase involved in cell wall biosynthesis
MSVKASPQMSVVLVTPDRYDTICKTINCLRKQTVRHQLEVVIVAPSADGLELDESAFTVFHQSRVVELGEIKSTGKAIAAGVQRASAPLVVYAEEHSYPESTWAEALIEAHRQPWAAVGVVIANANPTNMVSWASLFTDFGPWVEPVAGGETSRLPWHHAAYRRAILLEYGPKLQTMLETEGVLHSDLRARGYRLYLEPTAKANHVNVSLLSSYLRAEFNGGRMYGATRARSGHWSTLRRLIYVGAMPLIPLVRLKRVLRDVRRSGRAPNLLPRILPVLIVGLIAHAVGEVTGYAVGAGDAAHRRVSFELNRYLHVTAQDREAGRQTVIPFHQ